MGGREVLDDVSVNSLPSITGAATLASCGTRVLRASRSGECFRCPAEVLLS